MPKCPLEQDRWFDHETGEYVEIDEEAAELFNRHGCHSTEAGPCFFETEVMAYLRQNQGEGQTINDVIKEFLKYGPSHFNPA